MIRLHRPAAPPVLIDKAPFETALLWHAWENGAEPDIKRSIYAHPVVKKLLKDAQHRKCAYCETRYMRSHGTVEHFRPKLGWRQNRSDPLEKPQYFWLAYDWDNLLFSCDVCNDRSHKENIFPLSNPIQRATAANLNTAHEQPLLINPYEMDPVDYIEGYSRNLVGEMAMFTREQHPVLIAKMESDDA